MVIAGDTTIETMAPVKEQSREESIRRHCSMFLGAPITFTNPHCHASISPFEKKHNKQPALMQFDLN